MELHIVLSAVDDYTYMYVATVNVSNEEEVLDEVFHQFEVGFRHTGGGVQNEDKIDLGLITT